DGLRIGRDLGGVHGGIVPFFYFIHGTRATVQIEVIAFPEIIAGVDAAEGAVFDATFVVPLILGIGFGLYPVLVIMPVAEMDIASVEYIIRSVVGESIARCQNEQLLV